MAKAYAVLLLVSALSCLLMSQLAAGQQRHRDLEFHFPRRADRLRPIDDVTTDDESAVPTPEDPDGDGIIGAASKDYPILKKVPLTSFTCEDKIPGIYADVQTGCQAYHVCQADRRQESALCVNGTIFNQATFSCDWWYNVRCADSANYFGLNAALGKEPSPKRVNDHQLAAPIPRRKLKKPPTVPLPPPPPPPPSVPTPDFRALNKELPKIPDFFKPAFDLLDFPGGDDAIRSRPIKKLPTSSGVRFEDDLQRRPHDSRPGQHLQDLPPPLPVARRPSKHPVGSALKPSHNNDAHYGRNSFDPARHLPRPKPVSEKKLLTKTQSVKFDKSPQMLPVKSDDTVSGYSDLYLNKPVDED